MGQKNGNFDGRKASARSQAKKKKKTRFWRGICGENVTDLRWKDGGERASKVWRLDELGFGNSGRKRKTEKEMARV